jgi:hypothetical protein
MTPFSRALGLVVRQRRIDQNRLVLEVGVTAELDNEALYELEVGARTWDVEALAAVAGALGVNPHELWAAAEQHLIAEQATIGANIVPADSTPWVFLYPFTPGLSMLRRSSPPETSARGTVRSCRERRTTRHHIGPSTVRKRARCTPATRRSAVENWVGEYERQCTPPVSTACWWPSSLACTRAPSH